MLVNDDLANIHENSVTIIIGVKEFDKFAKASYGWFERIIRHWLKMSVEIVYLYDCVFKIEKNIFLKNDSVTINDVPMLVTNTDKTSNTIWCVSTDWSKKSFEKKDFENKYLLKSNE